MRGFLFAAALVMGLVIASDAKATVRRVRVIRRPVVVAPRVQRVVVPQAIIAPSVLVPQQQIIVPQRQTIIFGY